MNFRSLATTRLGMVAGLRSRFGGDGLVGATMLLASGTAGAHLITAGTMLFVSRFYSPSEVGLLAVFTALLTTTSVAACLRFDVAVALPSADDDAVHLLILGIGAAAVICALLAGVALAFPNAIAALLRQPGLRRYLWLLPIGVFAAASTAALQSWNIRRKNFRALVKSRLAQASLTALVQIVCGAAGLGIIGLVGGYVVGVAGATVVLGWSLFQRSAVEGASFQSSDLRRLASHYRRFPMLSTWEALANSAAIQLPVVMIAGLAAPAEAGYLMWAMYAVQAPMTLIGTAVGQVYLSHAPSEHHRGRLGEFTADVIEKLLSVGLGPLLAIGILAPSTFGLVFGPDWTRAGWLVVWMVPWFALQFIASPISMALHVLDRGRAAMLFQFYGLFVRVTAVLAAAHFAAGALSASYAISGAVVYATLLAVVIAPLDITRMRLTQALIKALPVTAWWVAGALTIAAAILVLRTG